MLDHVPIYTKSGFVLQEKSGGAMEPEITHNQLLMFRKKLAIDHGCGTNTVGEHVTD